MNIKIFLSGLAKDLSAPLYLFIRFIRISYGRFIAIRNKITERLLYQV
jgi:hypothetical protein